ncbi:helix-turn-helix transcriptional regulator [Proteinivorax tanatarense]|uniref:Helix-turn-helix transcriptional regulator n=1 Tax=Proteinivorax tanatarense TaxID=1260629 RepID=A0AAU7VMU9_9FIRM
MDMAERIQNLRKMQGISQEQLGDKIGVSRQAVSKWESNQSVPDLDKVILMSEHFNVTTDYILKGIKSSDKLDEKKIKTNFSIIVATALNSIGLIAAFALWYERQVARAPAIGLIFMVLGCVVYGLGFINATDSTKKELRCKFWEINIWLVSFIPLSLIYNVVMFGVVAPYPLLWYPLIAFPIFCMIYIFICFYVRKRCKKRMK